MRCIEAAVLDLAILPAGQPRLSRSDLKMHGVAGQQQGPVLGSFTSRDR